MTFTSLSLNGLWEMDYQQDVYLDTKAPCVAGAPVQNAVPGYWEDMADIFAQLPFGDKIRINPEFALQQYPMEGNPPDMALPNPVGNFFYKRRFVSHAVTAPASIHFAGVQNAVSAWLNGAYLGRHEGYSTPFDLEIPAGTVQAGENTILLSVSNHRLEGYDGEPVSGLTSRAANECTGGITGDVELRVYCSPLRDAAVQISEDCTTACVSVELAKPGAAFLYWAVMDGQTACKQGRCEVASGAETAAFSFDTGDLERWSPEEPKLYRLKLLAAEEAMDGKTALAEQAGAHWQTFGVRRLVAEGERLRLNGIPYYLRGICEHCYFPETVHPDHNADRYRRIIKTVKELGFNFIRFHTHIPEEEYLEAADELGILLHVESPNNTSLSEWGRIVKFCRRHPSVVIYCCGNELLMDDPFIAHLHKCADIVHADTDALFSPMSAMRGLEYYWNEPEQESQTRLKPFKHHPRRIGMAGEFCDVFSSYPGGVHSYDSLAVDPRQVDEWGEVYKKPRLSHEICIDGTYADLRLKARYSGTRIGKTALFSSVEKHLQDKGLLHKAPLYFKNSSEWQRRVRKYCFEAVRRSDRIAGYDFLGPVDTHWHTFGYDVGMMNEFYELKPGETVENVRRYNSPTVLLTDLGLKTNFRSGEALQLQILVSHFGRKDINGASLELRLTVGEREVVYKSICLPEVKNGRVCPLYTFRHKLPAVQKPAQMKLRATLQGEGVLAENAWELYLFPQAEDSAPADGDLIVTNGMSIDDMLQQLQAGKDILLLGKGPFDSLPTGFRIALAGRTGGNLATVVAAHPALQELPCEGFCSWQFSQLLEGGQAILFETDAVPFDPIIEVVSTHKYAIRQSALFEYRVEKGRLLVCSLDFKASDPAALWLKRALIQYAKSEMFRPAYLLQAEQLRLLAQGNVKGAAANTNFAFNANDKTAVRGKK